MDFIKFSIFKGKYFCPQKVNGFQIKKKIIYLSLLQNQISIPEPRICYFFLKAQF